MWDNKLGESNEWYTPPEILDALGLEFDLDPCSPGIGHWVPSKYVYTELQDGLAQRWFGLVFMNPPFGGRNKIIPWLEKFIQHGNGIGIARAYTSCAWFHDYIIKAEGLLFPRGKTKFIRPDGSIGASPGHGIVMFSIGKKANEALRRSGLGFFIDNKKETK